MSTKDGRAWALSYRLPKAKQVKWALAMLEVTTMGSIMRTKNTTFRYFFFFL